jgi:hypothetical protein
MRLKQLAVILTAAAALTLAGVVGSTAYADGNPPTTVPCFEGGCGGGDGVDCNNNYNVIGDGLYRNYAGYRKQTIPAIGSSITVNIKMVSSQITSTGVGTAAWTGVDGTGGTLGHWIQAGLWYSPGMGLERYVEYEDDTHHTTYVGSASFGTSYAVTVTHVANGVWKAQVGGSSWVQTPTMSGTMLETQTTTESQERDPLTSCNGLDVVFTSMSPARNTMNIDVDPPDYVENVGSATFEGVQLQTGS